MELEHVFWGMTIYIYKNVTASSFGTSNLRK
jgi:hypothetical protein